ncbi:MAG: hypothetical protein P9X24_04410 [Candidatus Hatepunaea meridiana]|nr:hypothetical protein [Candidatus Hatepunaea meridiana]
MAVNYTHHAEDRLVEIMDKAQLSEVPKWIVELIIASGHNRERLPKKRLRCSMTPDQIKDILKILKRTRIVYNPDDKAVITVIYPFRERRQTGG